MKRRMLIGGLLFLLLGVGPAATLMTRSSHSRPRRSVPSSDLVAVRNAPAQQPTGDEWFARVQLDRSTMQRRDAFATPDGPRFTIFQGRTKDGAKVCVATEGRGALGSACDVPGFTTSPVIWVESGSAGPGGTPVTDWELSGLAAPTVARLELVDSTGRHRPVHLGRGNAFFVALSHGELKHGVQAVSLDVYGSDGQLLDSIAL